MRALTCLALIALIAAPVVSRAAAPPSPDSEQAKRLRFMEGGDSAVDKLFNKSAPDTGDATALPTDTPPPTPLEQWFASLHPMPGGGWLYLTSTSNDGADGTVLYFSTHHIMADGNVVTVWFRWEYETAQTQDMTSFRSAATREEFDCTRDAEIVISMTTYSDQDLEGKGNTIDDDPKTSRWAPIIPGTLGETELNWACDKVLKNAHQRKTR